MPTWETSFLVEPFPDTAWDRQALTNWEHAAPHHGFTPIANRRGVMVTARLPAEEAQTAVDEGRKEVDLFFPPSRFTVQNPRFTPSARYQRLLRKGAAIFLAHSSRSTYRRPMESGE